ncbi:amidase [Achromobacter sp. RTa]|uniref:amidase n=1 Tax=Achromobacter sp. RTa TaxID=1532557 RepID=UPI00068F8C29|nr:amidase [Achromobacter sp. RTa]
MALSHHIKTTLACALALPILPADAAAARAPGPGAMSIAQILQAQASGQLSCVDIALNMLNTIKLRDSGLKALLSVNQNLIADAEKLDELRRAGTLLPLHCVPIAVKDNIDMEGMATTGGAEQLRGNVAREDADALRRLRDAGALLMGKTNLDELAVSGSTISSLGGQTLNAYDPARFAAGSSGGSAVAVTTGMSLCALGTETVNSLRNAASSAGVVALRSTPGLVSRRGVIAQSSTMDVVGPICRSVDDIARLLAVMAEPRPAGAEAARAAAELQAGPPTPARLAGKRFGVLANLSGKGPEHESVNAIIRKALDALRAQGVQIVEIDDAEFDSDLSSKRLNVANYEFGPLFEAFLARLPTGAGPASLRAYVDAGRYPAGMGKFLQQSLAWQAPLAMPEYREALRYGDSLRGKVLGLMETQALDALVYPAQKRPPLAVGETPRPERNGIFASALGLPAIDLPAGFTPPDAGAPVGLPVGLDLLARPGDDARLLGLAMAVEQTLQARREPPAADRR